MVQVRAVTVDDEASCISQTRQCIKIFYIASHTILASKLFVVYLIFFHSVLKDKMVLQREQMVFELLEHLSIVNMQLYECRVKIWNYSGFVWHFLCIN